MGKDFAVWTEGLIEIFLDLCIKEIENNNRPHTHFSQKGWENLEANFAKETGKIYTRKQLKNKWDGLKGDWKLWKDLKGRETGLGWDPLLQTIDASDEWWNQKLKSVRGKDYGKLRKKGLALEFEAKLDILFMNVAATGSYAYSPASSHPLPSSPVDLVEGSGDFEELLEQQPGKRKVGEIVHKGKQLPPKRKREKSTIGEQLIRMVDMMETTSSSIKSARPPTRPTIDDVMKEIRLLPGMVVGSPLFFFAATLFCNREKRWMFTNLKEPDLQIEWIKYEQSLLK